MQLASAHTSPDERRLQDRHQVAILGRYMLSDRREYPCQTVDASPDGLSLVAPVVGVVGERVVVYLEYVGRVEGTITRPTPSGFAMTVAAPQRKREKLASQLAWLANRQALGLAEDRRHERIELRRSHSTLTFDGRSISVRVIDVSVSGAALSGEETPPLGTQVVVGRTPARVVRHIEGGFAVEFVQFLDNDALDEDLTL